MPRSVDRGYTLRMQEFSEVPTDTGAHQNMTENWQSAATSTLHCVACGAQFEASAQQPRVRCPICGTVGYADRAGRNLVSTDWDCLACGTRNPEITNFCFECGTGLTTRCLRCEFPVYTSTCHRCGSQQDKLLRMQVIEQERAEWIPIQRSVLDEEQRRIEAQRAKQEKQEARQRKQTQFAPEPISESVLEAEAAPQVNTAGWQGMWPQVDRQMRVARQQRAQRIAQQRADQMRRFWRGLRSKAMTMAWLIVGLTLFLWQSRAQIPGWLTSIQQTPAGTAVTNTFNTWYGTLQSVVGGRGPVDTASPEYTVFFAVTVFGIAAIPVLLYLLGRIARWVFR
jgi:predicted RNA-binding Zn-ribbon protein involved in translation (DUF1610 family)